MDILSMFNLRCSMIARAPTRMAGLLTQDLVPFAFRIGCHAMLHAKGPLQTLNDA